MSANRRDLIRGEVEKRWRRLRDLSKEVLGHEHELDNGEGICEAFKQYRLFLQIQECSASVVSERE